MELSNSAKLHWLQISSVEEKLSLDYIEMLNQLQDVLDIAKAEQKELALEYLKEHGKPTKNGGRVAKIGKLKISQSKPVRKQFVYDFVPEEYEIVQKKLNLEKINQEKEETGEYPDFITGEEVRGGNISIKEDKPKKSKPKPVKSGHDASGFLDNFKK